MAPLLFARQRVALLACALLTGANVYLAFAEYPLRRRMSLGP